MALTLRVLLHFLDIINATIGCSGFNLRPGLEQVGCLLKLWDPDFHSTETSTHFRFWREHSTRNESSDEVEIRSVLHLQNLQIPSMMLVASSTLNHLCGLRALDHVGWASSHRMAMMIPGQEQSVMLSRCFKPQIRETPSQNRWTPEIQQRRLEADQTKCLEPTSCDVWHPAPVHCAILHICLLPRLDVAPQRCQWKVVRQHHTMHGDLVPELQEDGRGRLWQRATVTGSTWNLDIASAAKSKFSCISLQVRKATEPAKLKTLQIANGKIFDCCELSAAQALVPWLDAKPPSGAGRFWEGLKDLASSQWDAQEQQRWAWLGDA